MRAITYTQTGDPEVLTVVDRPQAEPGPGEVRVRIHRSGVNPTDWKSRSGAGPGNPVDPPQVPNQDGSGVVDAVGHGVEEALLGLRVWIWESAYQRPEGTAQDYALVSRHNLALLPDLASFDLGASLGVPFLTAHRALTVTEGGPVRLGPGTLQGRSVLVSGGAGAVGNAAIQLARWSDATVITTVSGPEKGELARRAGAHHVVDYKRSDAAAEVRAVAPDGVHVVVEVAPGPNAALDAAVVAPGAVVAVYANDGGDDVVVPVRAHMAPNTRYQFVLVYTVGQRAKDDAVAAVSAAVADGALEVGEDAGLPLHRFALADTGAAHAAVEAGVTGKVLVDVVAAG